MSILTSDVLHCSSESSDSDGDGNKADEAVTSTIREEDLPPEISTTVQSWLFRSSKSPSPKSKEGDEERERKRKRWYIFVIR